MSEATQVSTPRDRPLLWLRTLLGLLLAPVAGGMVVTGGMAVLESGGVADVLPAMMFGAFYGGVLGGLPALVIGWPLHLLLWKQGWTSVWVYISLGTVIGALGLFVTFPILGAFG